MYAFKEKKIKDLNIEIAIPSVKEKTDLPQIYKTDHYFQFNIASRLSLVYVGMVKIADPTHFNPQ